MSDNATQPTGGPVEEEKIDLGVEVDEAVRKAVRAAVGAKAKSIADTALKELLTDDVAAEMRETALAETRRTLRPDVHETEDEQAPKLQFQNLSEFVERYVANVYRREVKAGTERVLRWCPRWWDHGEAVARLEALWRAFEQSCRGEGSEMSTWWINHADPHMDRLLALDGPFKYCSVGQGHNTRGTLAKLPTISADVFQDGHSRDEAEVLSPSGLVVPAASAGRRRVVMEFPG